MANIDESDCHRIRTALDEALTNAYYHGNLEVRSEIREHDTRGHTHQTASEAGRPAPELRLRYEAKLLTASSSVSNVSNTISSLVVTSRSEIRAVALSSFR